MNLIFKRLTAVVAALCTISGAAIAADHSLDDLSWLTGHWIDTRDPEKPIEVRWNAANGNAMVGTWRKNNGNSLAYYEMLTMREIASAVFYRFDFFEKDEATGLFAQSSSTRLELMEARLDFAVFKIVGEENWKLTMEIEDGVLSGWMEDTNKPDAEKFYSYVAAKQ